jgi:hypothetical protein
MDREGKMGKSIDYRQELMDYNFSDRYLVKSPELDVGIRSVYELLEFYLLISVYDDNKNNLQALRYYYYGWWRQFLYEFANEVEYRTKIDQGIDEHHPTYRKDISYTSSLERLDRLCGFENLPKNFKIHGDGG